MPLVILIGSITFCGISGDIELYEPQYAKEDVFVCVKPIEEISVDEIKETPRPKQNNKRTKSHKRKQKKSYGKYIGTFKTTAYCPCKSCSEGYGKHTATGHIATEGRTIAVDKSVIPYGTTVYIEGLGKYRSEDCGGAVNWKIIDIYVEVHSNTYKSKYNKRRKVWIVDEGEKNE